MEATGIYRSKGLAGAALIMMSSFVLSRAAGLARDVAISYRFGTGPEVAAYLAAIRIPDLIFQIVAGGAVGSAFIPVFAGYLTRDELSSGWRMVSTLFNLSLAVLTPIIILLAVLSPQLIGALAPRMAPEYQSLAADLSRILMISPLFFTIGCFTTSVLNSFQRFFLASLAPTAYNVGIIFGALVLAPAMGPDDPRRAVFGLAIGATIGSALFLLVQLPGLWMVGMRYTRVLDLAHAGVREVGKLMLPRTLGLAVAQVNFVVAIFFASGIPGGIPSLNFAWLLTMLPLGVFAMAISTAVFPSLAAQSSLAVLDEVRRTLSTSLRFILYLTIPASVALIVLGEPIVRLLWERGQFDATSTAMTVYALRFYAPGLIAMAAVEIVTRAFYAWHDTRTPVMVAVLAVIVYIAAAAALVGPLSHGGLALATSVASVIEAIVLLTFASHRLPSLFDRKLALSVGRTVAGSLAMAVAVSVAWNELNLTLPPATFLEQLIAVGATTTIGLGVYLAVTAALRSEEVGWLARAVASRLSRQG